MAPSLDMMYYNAPELEEEYVQQQIAAARQNAQSSNQSNDESNAVASGVGWAHLLPGFSGNAWARLIGQNVSTNNNGSNDSNGNGSGGSGYWLGGSSGGYGSGAQNETAAKNLRPLTEVAMQETANQYDRSNAILDQLNEYNEKLAELDRKRAEQSGTNDWFKRQQQLQSAAGQIANSLPNMSGSLTSDLISGIVRADDMSDTDVLSNMQQQWNEIETQYAQSQADIMNQKSTNLSDHIRDVVQMAVDWLTNLSNLNPEYLNEAKYWSDILGGDELDEGEVMSAIMDNAVNWPPWIQEKIKEFELFDIPDPKEYNWLRPADSRNAAQGVGSQGNGNTSSSANRDYWRSLRTSYDNRKA